MSEITGSTPKNSTPMLEEIFGLAKVAPICESDAIDEGPTT
jgi:hypothetical protein